MTHPTPATIAEINGLLARAGVGHVPTRFSPVGGEMHSTPADMAERSRADEWVKMEREER